MKNARLVLLENILSNYAYAAVMGIVTLAAIPIYARTLGSTQWGIVAICMTAQGLLLILDAGLGQVMPGEVARASKSGRAREVYTLSLRLYGAIGLSACVVGQVLAGTVARHLSSPSGAEEASLEIALRLLLVQFAFQFSNNAAIAFWNGTEMQKAANLRLASFSGIKHGAALLSLAWWQPTAVAYMLPFLVVSGVEFFANHLTVIFKYPNQKAKVSETGTVSLKGLVKKNGGFSVAIVVGMLTSQIDKLFLVGTVSTELFGIYVLAASAALTLMHLHGPIQRAFLPRIAAANEPPWPTIWRLLWILTVACVLPCMIIASQAERILVLWLGDPHIARTGAPVFGVIAMAVGLNGLYAGIYTLFLRENLFWQVIKLNCGILVGQWALLVTLAPRISIEAGAWSWMLCALCQVVVGTAILNRFRNRPRT